MGNQDGGEGEGGFDCGGRSALEVMRNGNCRSSLRVWFERENVAYI